MSVDTAEQVPPPAEAAQVETPQKRRQRISTGVLIAVVGVLLLIGLASTTGSARFALSDAFDEVQLPTVTVPGFATVMVCALLCLAAASRLPVRPDAWSVAGISRSGGGARCGDGFRYLGSVRSGAAFPGQQPVRRHLVPRHAAGVRCTLRCVMRTVWCRQRIDRGSIPRRRLFRRPWLAA